MQDHHISSLPDIQCAPENIPLSETRVQRAKRKKEIELKLENTQYTHFACGINKCYGDMEIVLK